MAGRSGTNLKNNYWPEDLLLSILATLPTKSLLRFKCVSMHWPSLIINPYFIEQHLEEQQKNDYPHLIFATRATGPVMGMVFESMHKVFESMAIVDVEVGDEEGAKIRKGLKQSSSNICHLPCFRYFMSNSCDGIICLFGITNVFVYNPRTREFRIVKMQKKGFSPVFSSSVDFFGTHFCSLNFDNPVRTCLYSVYSIEDNLCLEFQRHRIVYSSVMFLNEVIAKQGMGRVKGQMAWFEQLKCSLFSLVSSSQETNNRAYSDIFFAVRIFPKDFLVGFGRDQVTKECKIIRLFTPKEENHIHECEVFTLSSDAGASWRGLGEVAYFIRAAQLPVYLNGALHWILDVRHANPSEVIVSFDLHIEKFQAISHPSCFSEVSDRRTLKRMGLLSLRSSLCRVEGKYKSPPTLLNIWIMNQSNGIWEKMFSINWGLTEYGIAFAFRIAELKDGTFLVLRYGRNLEIFDPESQSDSEMLIQHENSVDYYANSESLVPLYGKPLVELRCHANCCLG